MKRTLLSSNPVCLQSNNVHRLISEQSSYLLCDAMDGYSCDQLSAIQAQVALVDS